MLYAAYECSWTRCCSWSVKIESTRTLKIDCIRDKSGAAKLIWYSLTSQQKNEKKTNLTAFHLDVLWYGVVQSIDTSKFVKVLTTFHPTLLFSLRRIYRDIHIIIFLKGNISVISQLGVSFIQIFYVGIINEELMNRDLF